MKTSDLMVLALAITTCTLTAAEQDTASTPETWARAEHHAVQANEALTRCHRLVYAWYEHKGAGNYLLPQNLRSRIWNGQNAAADLWSFFVITTHLTDRKAFDTFIRQTLLDEIRLTTRVGTLPDDYDIDKHAFARPEPDIGRLLVGASEYVKDGLVPIVEVMGRTAWFHRACGLLDDIFANAPVETPFGKIPSDRAELNGEMLQSLCRFYGATAAPRYKQWAERIGDAYFLDALPKCNDLPCHSWDFAAGKPRSDRLSLSDHGNEIIFGLSELAVLEHVHDPAKAKQYLPAMRRMLDKLLAIAVNEDGLWFHSIEPSTGNVLKRNTPDTWGYALDAVYAFYLVTGETKYRDVVHRALRGINANERYLNWGGADAFADSIESGIVLLNRIPEPEGFAWLEKVVPVFLAKQKDDGIVEGWHGDGNYARTALMYALMKTAGTHVRSWRHDLKFGAVIKDDVLHVHVSADKPWQGKLQFDYPRHRIHFGLEINYPRLNEFPEWYTVEPTRLYAVTVNGKQLPSMLGYGLIRGLALEVDNEPVRVVVRPEPGPPYGERTIRIEAPPAHGGDGLFRLSIVVRNETGQPQVVKLNTSFGKITPAEAQLGVGASLNAVLTGDLSESTQATVELSTDSGTSFIRTIRLVHGKNLVGFVAFDDEEYGGRRYLWCGRRPIAFDLPARPGQAHTLHLLWGSKNDKRSAVVTVNGVAHKITKGGYDGFEWVTLKIEPTQVTKDTLEVRIEPDLPSGKAAFISEAKLTSP